MPLYEYCCDACGFEDQEFQHMQETALTVCPKCKKPTYRRLISVPHTDMKEFWKPIEMYSIALSDTEEIRAFKTRCPDVFVSEDPEDEMFGVPIARTRKQKLAALRVSGFAERS